MRVHYLPVGVIVVLTLTFFTTYLIAVLLGHVDPDLPYISDTGTQSPESCIFGQLLNIAAVLAGLTIYVRFLIIQKSFYHHAQILKLNRITLCLGMCAALGMSIVGNFQETNVLIVHLIGAILAFGVGTIYCWIQSYMSYHMHPQANTKCMFYLRIFICSLCTLTFIITHVADAIAKHYFHGTNKRKWYPSDGGFVPHVISATSEWIMAGSFFFYFATYIKEFKQFKLIMPHIENIDSNSSYQDISGSVAAC